MYMVRFPKIERWSSRSHIRERTLQDCNRTLLWIDAVNDPIAGGKDGL